MLSCRDHLSPGISLHTSKLSITFLAKEKEILAKAKEIDILKGNNHMSEVEGLFIQGSWELTLAL